MKKSKEQNFNYSIFFALILLSIVPTIYQTVRVYLISSIPNVDGLSISGHIEWFDLINETIQAFLIIPLYYLMNKFLNDKELFKKRVSQVGLIIFLLYGIFALIINIYSSNMVNTMVYEIETKKDVLNYIRLENIAFMIGILFSYTSVLLVILNKSKYIYCTLIIKTVLTILGDLYFIPTFGVNGVAFTNIVINLGLVIVSAIILKKENLLTIKISFTNDYIWLMDWVKTGCLSGMQVFIDNIVYALMICKMVNEVSEQGNYWVANNFIWGYLLVPILALGEIIKKDCKENCKSNVKIYIKITLVVVAIWVITIPLYNIVFKYMMNIKNTTTLYKLVLMLLPFYIVYSLGSIISNIFYGRGKMNYLLINSIIVNFIYYGILYVLFKNNIFTPTLTSIALMFGFGMVVNFIINIVLYKTKYQRYLKAQTNIIDESIS